MNHLDKVVAVKPFLSDRKLLRDRAVKDMEQGAVTAGYRADREALLKALNDSLATELVCVLRYKRHHYMAKGITAKGISAEFAQHASEELAHADLLAERIVQLGGEPDFSPVGLAARSHSEYTECADLREMIRENLIAERIAIGSYGDLIRYVGNNDPTTRVLLEGILAQEEEHAEDLSSLL